MDTTSFAFYTFPMKTSMEKYTFTIILNARKYTFLLHVIRYVIVLEL